MSRDKKIWLITGVSRGLGKALAQAVLDQADTVISTTANVVLQVSFSSKSHVMQHFEYLTEMTTKEI